MGIATMSKKSWAVWLPCLLGGFMQNAQAADEVQCEVSYGGETQTIRATPAASPYQVQPLEIGSHFLFRIVFETEPRALAAIKIYTYGRRDDVPVIVHQASYAYPVRPVAGRYGFTGQQAVYEGRTDAELQYWCRMARSGRAK